LQADHLRLLELMPPAETPRRDRLILLHAIRIAVIQRICLIATDIPGFSPQQGVAPDDILARILELDVANAIDRLARIFPTHENGAAVPDDFGEPSDCRPEPALTYAVEHGALFGPLTHLYDLARRMGTAITLRNRRNRLTKRHAKLGAIGQQRAIRAARTARIAYAAAVQNQAHRKRRPFLGRQELLQVDLDLNRIEAAGEIETARQPPHMRIYHHPGLAEDMAQHHVRRFPAYSG
jgi:hypothetical protein